MLKCVAAQGCAYLLIGGSMVTWGAGWVVGMGYVFLLSGGVSLLLYPVYRGGDLAFYSYGGYVLGTLIAWLSGLLEFSAFPSDFACGITLLGGVVFSVFLLPILILLIGCVFAGDDS